MLEKMKDLPPSVVGIRASGKLTKEDYESVFVPLLEEARREGRQVRVLYQFGPSYEGFTPGAIWDDFRLGLKFLPVFERCALVADVDWIRAATEIFAPFLPCPARAFRNAELRDAIAWLETGSGSEKKSA